MLEFQSENVGGFLQKYDKDNNCLQLIQRDALTSDDPRFYVFTNEICRLFINKHNIPVESINYLLVILSNDNKARVYRNYELQFQIAAKLNTIKRAGEFIYLNEIEDIKEIFFPEISIKNNDAVIVCLRENWKYALYFDFTRDINVSRMQEELAQLIKPLVFEKFELKDNPKDIIFTEGKTDWKHLKKAMETLSFNATVDFLEEDVGGCNNLLIMCKNVAKTPNIAKRIFIFDDDIKITIRDEVTDKSSCFKDWGNDVFSLVIPKPNHRKEHAGVCLELYYQDEDIEATRISDEGFYFTDEINKSVCPHKIITIIDKVEELRNSKKPYELGHGFQCDKIILSKEDFASKVLNGDYDGILDFTAFKLIIEIIQQILEK